MVNLNGLISRCQYRSCHPRRVIAFLPPASSCSWSKKRVRFSPNGLFSGLNHPTMTGVRDFERLWACKYNPWLLFFHPSGPTFSQIIWLFHDRFSGVVCCNGQCTAPLAQGSWSWCRDHVSDRPCSPCPAEQSGHRLPIHWRTYKPLVFHGMFVDHWTLYLDLRHLGTIKKHT